MSLRLATMVFLAGLALLFVLQNVGVMEIRFLFWSFAMSRSLALVLVLAIGIGIGWSWHGFSSHRRKHLPGNV